MVSNLRHVVGNYDIRFLADEFRDFCPVPFKRIPARGFRRGRIFACGFWFRIILLQNFKGDYIFSGVQFRIRVLRRVDRQLRTARKYILPDSHHTFRNDDRGQ